MKNFLRKVTPAPIRRAVRSLLTPDYVGSTYYVVKASRELGLPISRILHIGANDGAEAAFYARNGIEAYHVEALPDVYETLKDVCAAYDNQHAVLACLDSVEHEVEFHIASNDAESSSLLEPGTHAIVHPDVTFTKTHRLTTRRLDDVVAAGEIPADVDMAILDVQGAELRVLSGATEFLTFPRLKALVLEVSLDPLYEGGASFDELIAAVGAYGFRLKHVEFNSNGWSDSLFLKRWWPEVTGETPPLRQ